MRFLVAPGGEATERARPPVRWFLSFAAVLVVALAVQRGVAGGLSPHGVLAHYLGEDGAEPLAAVALWEEVHVNAFVYGFLLVMLGSLHAVSPLPARARALLLGGGALAAAADLAAPFAVVAAHGLGALRVVTFAATVAFLLAGIGVAFARFGRPVRAGA
ncbi:MAG TPA: hypothetical protein VFP65_24295 [Anaeromyxobacteraceae bacterium]|nr:hypothetical protein [Anaeromyxobacteraceae bacterium]